MEWFADTGLVLGDKDSYQNLQGVLVYEWGELDSLNRRGDEGEAVHLEPKDRFAPASIAGRRTTRARSCSSARPTRRTT
jgi:hypothetical protein